LPKVDKFATRLLEFLSCFYCFTCVSRYTSCVFPYASCVLRYTSGIFMSYQLFLRALFGMFCVAGQSLQHDVGALRADKRGGFAIVWRLMVGDF
jgi:hypothetical protein